jgi:8-oxo-dGTP pyrophosphatase MutT (NUDIX family)
MSESEAPTPARNAASILLLRGTAPEVLMGLRGAHHTFMPNHLVFPGGAVDAADHHAPIAALPHAGVMARLGPLGPAILHAAARELMEETGLSLGDPPDLSEVDYLCRAVAPARYSTRFDARFLVIGAEHARGTLAGSGELESLRWYGVAEALALDLAFPTRKVLEELERWLAASPDARRQRIATPTLRERVWELE